MKDRKDRVARVAESDGVCLWWNRVRGGCVLFLCAIVIWPYAVSIGAAGATFTLVNKTPYYLHAVINNVPLIYIPPGGVADYDAAGLGNVTVEVRTSPGQRVNGSASRSFKIIYHTTYSQSTSNTCQNNSSDCSNTAEASSTTTAEPVRWEVTASELTWEVGREP